MPSQASSQVMAGMRGDTMRWPQTAVVAPAGRLGCSRDEATYLGTDAAA
jgi:hypothetical protein